MAQLKKILNWTSSGILILALLFTLSLIITSKMNDGKAAFLGKQLMVVLSGSMSPTFDTGSVVAVEPVRFEDIKKGDIVTFQDIDGATVTHRVLEKQEKRLITKGDANKAPDINGVAPDQVIGKVRYWVPKVGYLIEFAKSKKGILFLVILPGIYLVLSRTWQFYRIIAEAEKSKEDSKTVV